MKRLFKLESLIYEGQFTGLDLHHDLNLEPDWFNFSILIFFNFTEYDKGRWKDLFSLSVKKKKRKQQKRKRKKKSPWRNELQTFAFCTQMFYYWATETLVYQRCVGSVTADVLADTLVG